MEAPPLERKLVAILAADVAGYSRMMGIDEEGTLATLSAYRAVSDMLIERYGGRICGTAGDSVLAEFTSVFTQSRGRVLLRRTSTRGRRAPARRVTRPASRRPA